MIKQATQLNIIAFAQNSWHGVWMNRQQLLSRLGVYHNILFSNGIWFAWDVHNPEWKDSPWFGSFTLNNAVWVDVAPKLVIRWPRHQIIDRTARKLCAIRWLRKLLGNKPGPFIAYAFSPHYEPYIDDLKPEYVVYHAYDLYSQTPGWSEELAEQEARLLARADLILASSNVIAQHLGSISGRSVLTLPNAVDYQAYRDVLNGDRPLPEDLAEIPHPRIGYTGCLNRKVDFSLIEQLACQRPHWQFVIVGGAGNFDQHSQAALDACKLRDNIHFLGHKAITELPLYITGMDVNIMSYRISSQVWTSGIYPLKLHDYMAAGKPIVSSDVPAVREFSSQLAIARSSNEWDRALQDAINLGGIGTPEGRRNIARQNTWDARVTELDMLLSQMTSKKKIR